MDLCIDNREKVVTLVIRTYYLTFSSELVLELDNRYFIPLLDFKCI
jgi:hypothetical protein